MKDQIIITEKGTFTIAQLNEGTLSFVADGIFQFKPDDILFEISISDLEAMIAKAQAE